MTISTHVGKNCPYCQAPIKPDAQVISCTACGIPHHSECWQENKGCTTYGCQGSPTAVQGAAPPPMSFTPNIPPPPSPPNYPQPEYLPETLPPELRKWNWGAFVLALFWSAAMKQWGWFVLCFIPYVAVIPHVYLAIKGNEVSWKSRHWASLEQFKATQEVWNKWGIGVFCCLLVVPIFAALLFPVFARARENARQTACMSNQRQICLAIEMYAQDNNGNMPDGQTIWATLTSSDISPKVLVCPTAGYDKPNAYGYNQQLSGFATGRLPHPNTLLMTADGGDSVNLLHSVQDISYRHRGFAVGSYCDGHVESIPEGQPVILEP